MTGARFEPAAPGAPPLLWLSDLEAFDPGAPDGSRERRFCCPLPACADKRADAAHRSLSVNVQSGVWFCRRCAGTGLLGEYRAERPALTAGRRSRQAVRRAFSLAPQPSPPTSQPSPRPNWRRRLKALCPIVDTAGTTYLERRGIPSALAAAVPVAYAERWDHWEKVNGAWRQIGADRRVVFPIRNRDGDLVAVQARAIDETHLGSKVITLGDKKDGVFDALGGLAANPIVLAEAPFDALSIAACGLPALARCGTSGPDWLPSAAAFRSVLLATDADAGGDAAADALAATLTLGSRCRRLRPPLGKDWNEALLLLGGEALRVLIATELVSGVPFPRGGLPSSSRLSPPQITAATGTVLQQIEARLVTMNDWGASGAALGHPRRGRGAVPRGAGGRRTDPD